jgi:hypothetical protein
VLLLMGQPCARERDDAMQRNLYIFVHTSRQREVKFWVNKLCQSYLTLVLHRVQHPRAAAAEFLISRRAAGELCADCTLMFLQQQAF